MLRSGSVGSAGGPPGRSPRRGFPGLDASEWLGRIGRSHAVLSTLQRIHGLDASARASALERPAPGAFKAQVGTLLERRFAGKPHCEQTISATAAAYELHMLVGGALTKAHAGKVEAWLRERFEVAYDVDRLTIARTLGDRELLAGALDHLEGRALSPLLMTHLCEAALATGQELPPLAQTTGPEADELERSLDGTLVLSARYLAAVSDYTARH